MSETLDNTKNEYRPLQRKVQCTIYRITVPTMKQSVPNDLNELQTFYWIVKSGSFTGAARALSLPKSSVSRQIAKLERRLGARLIARTTRRIAVTEVGQLFLAHCERVVSEAAEAEHAVSAYSGVPHGLLRIGTPLTFGRRFLAPVLPVFCRKYPDIRVEIVFHMGRLDPIAARLDVVIQVGHLEDSSYVSRKLATVGGGFHASPSYLHRQPLPRSIAELANHRVIMSNRAPGGARWKLVGPNGKSQEIRLDPYVTVPDPIIARDLAYAGLGIAMLPQWLTRDDDKLVSVLPKWRTGAQEICALYPARQLTPLKLRVFLDELELTLKMT